MTSAMTVETATSEPRFRRAGFVSILAAAMLAGASCKDDRSSSDVIDAGRDVSTPLALCAPRDPARHPPSSSGFYPYSALPVGACASSGSRCAIGIYGPCGTDPEYVGHPYNGFECTCLGGTWSCEITSHGGSVCSNRSLSDGGADTSDDGGPRDSGIEAGEAASNNAPCPALNEAGCVAAAGRCHSIFAQSLEQHCNGGGSAIFAGCVTGGPDGGAAITWGLNEATGQRARFSSTQLPNGWTPIEEPACPVNLP